MNDQTRKAALIIGMISIAIALFLVLGIPAMESISKPETSSTPVPNTPIPETLSADSGADIIPPYLEAGMNEDTIVIGAPGAEIHTNSPVEFSDPPEGAVIPAFYNLLEIPYLKTRIYGFTDSCGNIALRAYGTCSEMINNVPTGEISGFWPVEIRKDTNGMPYLLTKAPKERAEDTYDDAYIPERAEKSKDDENLFRYFVVDTNLYTCFSNNLNQSYRTWATDGRLYPCSSLGVISAGALPVDFILEEISLYEELPDSGTITIADFSYPVDLGSRLNASVIPGGRK